MHHIIWNPLHVPRHSFILWLVAKCRLRTMDRMHNTSGGDHTCKLCNSEAETHDHLFFQCRYSFQVWQTIMGRACTRWPSLPWTSLLEWASTRYNRARNMDHMIGPLLLASSVYHLWQERNSRFFHNHAKSVQTSLNKSEICSLIHIIITGSQRPSIIFGT